MPVIAVVNRKGGSGKSTLATHLAAHCARRGLPAMLGDVDRQQSTQTWLRLRAAQQLPDSVPIVGWAMDPRQVLRPPAGITHVVLDTPGGLRGFDLARVVGWADAILMPVCNSVFDRESAADCHAEPQAPPRPPPARSPVAAIGMRPDARTRAADTLAAWAAERGIHFLGALRETQAYVRSVEQGLSLFDLPPAKVAADLAQWEPILDWLAPWFASRAAEAGRAVASADGVAVAQPVPTLRAVQPPRVASGERVPVCPQALAQAARATLVVPPNLGDVTPPNLRARLGRWLGAALPQRRGGAGAA